MSCKKESEYQKFLKEWKEKNIKPVVSMEVRRNWLKHASADWNAAKKAKESEREKKEKEKEAACKLKAATSAAKVSGTPLRVSTASTPSSLGLSAVALPEKRSRTLQQCRLDLATQSAILAKRNAKSCASYCAAAAPRPASVAPIVDLLSGLQAPMTPTTPTTPTTPLIPESAFRMRNRPQHSLRFF